MSLCPHGHASGRFLRVPALVALWPHPLLGADMAAETGCSCGEHETAALVRRSVVMIEKLADVVIAKNAAEATVEVVRRALGRFGDGARRRDPDGQPCWCDVREATWEEEHE